MEKDLKMMLEAFPRKYEQDIVSIFDVIELKSSSFYSSNFEVHIGNETLKIPERIYYDEIENELFLKLSQTQQYLLDCYYTRHHNGYIRQRKLNKIFENGEVECCVIPYIMRLIGEYVVEIINEIHNNIKLVNQIELGLFIAENEKFTIKICGRIASYWGEYYRSEYEKKNYPGFKLMKMIKPSKESNQR